MRDSTKALIALMEQENGVTEFQCLSPFNGEWRDCKNPLAPIWKSVDTTFRVKPKPIEVWAWKYQSGLSGMLYKQKQPDDSHSEGRVMVLLREVTE